MKPHLLIAAAVSAFAATATATPARAGEVYAGMGLPGLMLGYAQPVNESLTVRADWATLGSRNERRTEEGVTYDASLGFNRLGVFGDWFVAGGFRFTGGITFNNLKADLVARGDGVTVFDIGGTSFVASPDDRLNVTISYPRVTPYLGVGYGHQMSAGLGFTFDLGVSYGKARVSETHSGPNLSNTTVVTQADIDRELAELRDGVARIRYIPQVSVGLNYRF